jgi:hypothetical protein
VSEAGFLELADPASGIQAWLGAGLPGLADGEVLAVISQAGELIAAGVTSEGSFELGDEGISARASLDGAEVVASATSAGGSLVLRREGEEQTLHPAAIGGPVPAASDKAGLVRVISVLPRSDGTAITASAARPAKASAHDSESLRAQVSPGGEATREVFEPLLSTQYDPAGGQARAGLELWVGPEDPAPLRVSGLRRSEARLDLAGGWELLAAPFIWALDGDTTMGSYLLWRNSGA